jgi:GTPase SAR1 family protein
MSKPHEFLAQLLSTLPPAWHEPVEALAAETLQADTPLRVTLLGNFSVGKSSLLNMLLQEQLLPAALEETTALPTFIEYGSQREMSLIGQDGSLLPLDEERFAQVTTQAPDGAACALLALPLSWLQDISIIDLPGLGSISATHREYTLAQIRQTDAVLYLLSPSGPSSSDMATLQHIQQLGKRVKVLVARWDEVEAATSRGEKLPSLEQWSRQIEQEAGLRTRLAPCHRLGLGREDILEFLQRAREDLNSIRLRRFQAELRPILQNALGQNAEQQRICRVETEAEAQTLHEELVERKRHLAEFKSGLYAEQHQDRSRLDQQASDSVARQRQRLAGELEELTHTLKEESDWERFGKQGCGQLNMATQQIAQMFSELSASYGSLDLPETEVATLNLRLPEPEKISAEDFLDMGHLTQLQEALASQQSAHSAIEQKLGSLHPQDLSEHEQALHELTQQQNWLATQQLPMTTQQVSNGSGAMIGRLLGEAADIGLMFVAPHAAGAKVASLVGKGAKMANIAVNTTKVARAVSTGVKVAKGVQQGQKSVRGVPQPVMDKLSGLEMLSLGYWGERLGSMFGGPITVQTVDQQALAEREAALAELEGQRQSLSRALARNEDIANERQLTGWALEQNQKEQARLQSELTQLQLRAEQKHRDALQHLQQERMSQLHRSGERAVTHWLQGFDRQAAAMTELLHAHVKSYWEGRVTSLLDERLQDIDQLATQTQASAQERQATLTRLIEDAQALQHTLATLH